MSSQGPRYIITTGWWCTNDDEVDDRDVKYGDPFIRSDRFHELWLEAVTRFTQPEQIYVIDSASPVKPVIDEQRETLISLQENAGHATNHSGKLAGVSRAHLLGMTLAYLNDMDYWVYVEQDALIYGEGIVEECIRQMRGDYMFGSGAGTAQPVQHALMIVKREGIPRFISNFTKIRARDCEISPEVKFALAVSWPLRLIPEMIYKMMPQQTKGAARLRRKIGPLFERFRGFDSVPFGYGRQRPIDFNAAHFYFQHGSREEIDIFKKKLSST